jgi:cell division protease FtsH
MTKPYSEETAVIIDQEISKIIENQYQRSIKILEDNKDKLTELAELLLEKEVIFKDDLEKIFGKRPFIKEQPIALKSSSRYVKEEDEEKTANEGKSEDEELKKEPTSNTTDDNLPLDQ